MNNSTAEIIISIIPIVGIGIGGVVVFFYTLWHHHENKLRIKMGTYQKGTFNYKAYTLLIGILLVGLGLLLSAFFALAHGSSPALLGGLIPLVIGICLLIFYNLNPDFRDADEK